MKLLFSVVATVLMLGGGTLFVLYSSSSTSTEIIDESSWGGSTAVSFDPTAVWVSSEVEVVPEVVLSVPGSVATKNVPHAIPLTEIRQGCARQDCIPSIDDPDFISVSEAVTQIPNDDIGIALTLGGVSRYYSFLSLVTREIVNDRIGEVPVLVTYCPLCGTGIVFSREVDGVVYEFGVSGMLWQSNLLMYNRADSLTEQTLWSQVLGEGVVGKHAGYELEIIPSDVVRFGEWQAAHPEGEVLTTGQFYDPYNGQYFEVAERFQPDFDYKAASINPRTRVHGIEIDGIAKAYPVDRLSLGTTTDMIGTESVIIVKDKTTTRFLHEDGSIIPDIEGMWFSWQSAYPHTTVYDK